MSAYNWLRQDRGMYGVVLCTPRIGALFSFSSPYYCHPSSLQKPPPPNKSYYDIYVIGDYPLFYVGPMRWHAQLCHELTHPLKAALDESLKKILTVVLCETLFSIFTKKSNPHQTLKSAVIARKQRINLTKFANPCHKLLTVHLPESNEFPCYSPLTWVYCL